MFLFEHDLFGKPVSTFPDHVVGKDVGGQSWPKIAQPADAGA